MDVLALLGRRGPTSRAAIARELGISQATVSQITKRLLEQGVIEPLEFSPSGGGRPGQLLGLVGAAGYAVGAKVAADHIAVVAVHLDGQVIDAYEEPFDVAATRSLTRLAKSLRSFISTGSSPLLGVGVGVPGIVPRPDVGEVTAAVLGWVGTPVGRLLREALGTPVLVENDVKALAMAERLYGAGRDVANFVVVTIGRGVGFAAVADGALRRGASGGAGEIAHVVVEEDGRLCACGNRGCLEAYVGAAGLVAAGRESGAIAAHEGLGDLARAAERGDRRAMDAFAAAASRLTRALAVTLAAIEPELIVVAGEGTAYWPHWKAPFSEGLARHLPASLRDLPVEVVSWEDTSWARGAAAIVLATAFDRHAPVGRLRPHVLARLHGADEKVDGLRV